MPISIRDRLILLLMASVALASASDILSDLRHGSSLNHILIEVFLMSLAAGLMLHMLWHLRRQKRLLENLKQELSQATLPPAGRNPALQQARERLNKAVNAQFGDWELSPSEAEVGWLLLKGLSIKEIAVLRETQEKTVRQQASSIYRKANLSGRHAFAAWFIEDLL